MLFFFMGGGGGKRPILCRTNYAHSRSLPLPWKGIPDKREILLVVECKISFFFKFLLSKPLFGNKLGITFNVKLNRYGEPNFEVLNNHVDGRGTYLKKLNTNFARCLWE